MSEEDAKSKQLIPIRFETVDSITTWGYPFRNIRRQGQIMFSPEEVDQLQREKEEEIQQRENEALRLEIEENAKASQKSKNAEERELKERQKGAKKTESID